jgi:hypothetical protein
VSGWGVGQHVEHCAMALDRIVGAISFLLVNPEHGLGLGPTLARATPMLESGSIPRGMGKAPEFLIPQPEPDRAQTRAQVEAARELWDTLSGKRDEMRECKATFAHFALGNFTSPQWVRFMAVHTAHHFKIVRDILDAAGLPTPFSQELEILS